MSDPNDKGNDRSTDTPGDDGKYVPRERLNEIIQENRTLSERLATLEGRLTEVSRQTQTQTRDTAPKVEEPTDYTRAQLNQAVTDGKISAARAEDIWQEQLDRRIERQIERGTVTAVTAVNRVQRMQADIEYYRTAKPDAFLENGNKDRKAVHDEYLHLTQTMGLPATQETELVALRTVFGPPKASVQERQHRESHRDVMGGDPPSDRDDATDERQANRAPKGLSRDERAYYEGCIGKGVYKDWNAVRDELKFANKGVRDRTAARHGGA